MILLYNLTCDEDASHMKSWFLSCLKRLCRYSSCMGWGAGYWCTADRKTSLHKAAPVSRWAETGDHFCWFCW